MEEEEEDMRGEEIDFQRREEGLDGRMTRHPAEIPVHVLISMNQWFTPD